MKFTAVIVSALAGLVAAAPTDKRSSFDLSQLNNLQSFNSLNLNYLLNINQQELDLQLLETLGSSNNFNILSFQNLFQSNSFDLNNLLELQQLMMLLQLEQLGLFNGFDLSSLNLNALQLGLVSNIGSQDLSQFISASALPQIQTIAQQVVSVSSVVKE